MYQSRLRDVIAELESIDNSIQESAIDHANLEGVIVEDENQEELRVMTNVLIYSACCSIDSLIDLLNGEKIDEQF